MPRKRRTRGRTLIPTAHQTTGPFFPAQYIRPEDNDLARLGRPDARPRGAPYYIYGHVRDAAARPAVNVIIEIWQPNADGKFNHPSDRSAAPLDPNFLGWGRTWTDRRGFYSFTTIKPGTYAVSPGSNRWFAPRINVRLIGSGLMRPLITCLYFPDEALNDDDPQLQAIRNAAARQRLVATPEPHESAPPGIPALRFDLCLGGRETSTFLED